MVRKQRNGYNFQKDALFDISSLVNQLYTSKSINFNSQEYGKIYFSENQIPDLISLGLNHLSSAIKVCKEVMRKTYINDKNTLDAKPDNKTVNELFRKDKENADINSNLEELYK